MKSDPLTHRRPLSTTRPFPDLARRVKVLLCPRFNLLAQRLRVTLPISQQAVNFAVKRAVWVSTDDILAANLKV